MSESASRNPHDEIGRAHARLDNHEKRIRDMEITDASMKEWRTNTTEKLNDIRSGVRWLILLILAALVSSGMSFVMDGGLHALK